MKGSLRMMEAHIELKTRPDCDGQQVGLKAWPGRQTYGLQSREDGQRQGGYLDGASDEVGDDEHGESNLRGSAVMSAALSQCLLTCHRRRLYGGRRS